MESSYSSALRVYEPLFSFPGRQRTQWSRYARRPVPGALLRERHAMLQAVIGGGVDFARLDVEPEALVAHWSGNTVVCPLDTRSRALQAIIDSEWKLPYPLSDFTLGRTPRRQAAGLQLHPALEGQETKDHVLTASWDVPFWWALMFDPEERVDVDDPEQVVYRAALGDCLERSVGALKTITEAFGDLPFVADLDSLVQWLRSFDGDSMVELDYGALGGLVVDEQTSSDDCVEFACEAMASLEEGSVDDAVAAYNLYQRMWEEIARMESWN